MKKLLSALLLFCFNYSIAYAEMEEGKIYRLDKSVFNLERTRDKKPDFIAAQNSKFVVVDNKSDDNAYIVRFITIYDNNNTVSSVTTDEEYKLARVIGDTDILKSVQPSLVGPVSGPLIVPFKYRLNDRSLSGEAAIGYYAGYRTEPRMPWTKTRISFSPFIAGGMSQVNTSINGETDNHTAVTLATGILIQNWANVNIGFVIGQDRIGDSTWQYEGKSWASFMVGWDL